MKPSPSQSPQSPSPNRRFTSTWKRILSLAAIPLGAVGAAVLGWMLMPKPQLPDALQFANDALPKRTTVKVPGTASTSGAPSSLPSQAQDHSATLGAPTPPIASGSKNLVALGDSVTFGFNLPGSTATKPSPYAFPYLIGSTEHWRVTDLGIPGAESSGLLAALNTKSYQTALTHANVVTLDIGSNDLLHTTYDLLAAVQDTRPAESAVLNDARYQEVLSKYQANLPQIVNEIRKYTKAPIILLTLYDPFPDGSSVHDIGEQLIAAANQVILQTAATDGLPVADVYNVFNHNQDTLVRLPSLDIHPTIQGQQALAGAVEDVLKHPLQHQPMFYAISAKGALVYDRAQYGPFAVYWLHGNDSLLVTGRQGSFLKVSIIGGRTGFVRQDAVTVLLRPFNDVSFGNHSEYLAHGTISDDRMPRSAPVYQRHGVLYAPIKYLADSAKATVTMDADTRTLNLSTLQHSGLIHTGLLNPTPEGPDAAGPSPSLHVETLKNIDEVSFSTQGIQVLIDGEAVSLGAEPIVIDNQVYVPAEPLWVAMGGTVTHDRDGLPKLSAAGS